MDRIVLVIPTDPSSLKKLADQLSGQTFTWGYLGRSVIEFHKTKSYLGHLGTYLDTANYFHKTANEFRESYLEYLYDIGKKLDSLRWWITGLSYRSSYATQVFRTACHLKVALSLVEKWDGPGKLVLVIPDKRVRAALMENLNQCQQEKVSVAKYRYWKILRSIWGISRMLLHRTYFIWEETIRLVQARCLSPRFRLPENANTLIVSYATRGNIKPDTDFHEAFFGDLAKLLNGAGCSVAVVPMILSEVKYLAALRDMRRSSVPLVIPHRYLKFRDVLLAALSTFMHPPRPRPLPRFSGMDISVLIDDDLHDYHISNWAADVSLVVASTKRLAQSPLRVERVIYIFENQPWERALCWAFRRYLPEVELVGYQHSRVPKISLNFFLASGGESEAPLPDRIVTVGKYSARILSENGHNAKYIRVGGALQLQNVFESRNQLPDQSSVDSTVGVLVASSNGFEEATELLDLALNLFDEYDGINVTLKFHPLMPFANVIGKTEIQMPEHVQVSEKPINELMLQASVMVYSGSTVCLQALALGLPIVHVKPRFDFDLDPLDSAPIARLEAEGIEQLRERVHWVLENRQEYIAGKQLVWEELVSDIYGPIEDNVIHAFLD